LAKTWEQRVYNRATSFELARQQTELAYSKLARLATPSQYGVCAIEQPAWTRLKLASTRK
jgi:hypothetical protein